MIVDIYNRNKKRIAGWEVAPIHKPRPGVTTVDTVLPTLLFWPIGYRRPDPNGVDFAGRFFLLIPNSVVPGEIPSYQEVDGPTVIGNLPE